jgi:hypothetical protein
MELSSTCRTPIRDTCLPFATCHPGSGRSTDHVPLSERQPGAGPKGLSLISSLIHLRVGTFGAHHTKLAAEVTDAVVPRRTPAHRLGKRVGTAVAHDWLGERPRDELSDNRHRQQWTPAGTHGGQPQATRVATWQFAPQLGFGTKRRLGRQDPNVTTATTAILDRIFLGMMALW